MNSLTTLTIDTPRLTLVCCTKEILDAVRESNLALAKKLDIAVPEDWTTNSEREFQWVAAKLSEPHAQPQWLYYLSVLKNENTLIGSGGFRGAPQAGVVEIGYEIAPSYRGNGFATEMAKAFIRFAFQHSDVTTVQAHTLAVENESGSVLKRCGLKWIEELDDAEDGKLWRWEIENKTA